MPAGPIGPVWASGSWADTTWEAGSWGGTAVVPSGPVPGGGLGRQRKEPWLRPDHPSRRIPKTVRVLTPAEVLHTIQFPNEPLPPEGAAPSLTDAEPALDPMVFISYLAMEWLDNG